MSRLVSEAVFRIAYEGEAVSDGDMDVADLAPALLAIGQLMKAAGRVVDGPEAEVSVRVKATQHACFEVWLSVAMEHAGTAWTFWKSDDTQAAKELVELVLGGVSVISLIRWARGRKPKRLPAKDGLVVLELDGTTFEVPVAVADMVEDPALRSAAEDAISDPLERDGIDAVVFGPKGAEQRVEKAESDWFKAPAMASGDEFVSRHTKAFSFVTLSFKAGQKWRLNDGGTQRSVQMSDKDFLAKVDSNMVAFRKGDLLICEVIETARRTAGGFKNDYEIVHVIDHRKAVPHPDLLVGVPPHASDKDA
jgi:hypothetical protein